MKNMLTVEAFADWAERQPANKRYDWISDRACAAAQYAAYLGLTSNWEGRHSGAPSGGLWSRLSYLAAGHETFGDLAAALRSVKP